MTEEKNKGGRPRKDLDEKAIFKLAELGCTMNEIAAFSECSVDVLERRCLELIQRGREHCKIAIRRAQINLALSGNPAMLIWLGKIILGQREIAPEELEKIKELLIKIHPSRLADDKGS